MDMKQMIRQAQKMQAQLAQAQEEIRSMTFEAAAGGGMVKAVVRGDLSLESISIDPAVVDPDDVEMLEDFVTLAVNEAIETAKRTSEEEMGAITSGLNIPGLM